ncbi:DUF4873 domain-containing protein [Antrihabitans sp. YC2-6]|uniref:DUF4873 domain-containing protein n=1 Tax=Antrihabitans sp. YC2-6 TaxID=2799498 RepID=UPI0018F621CB|nr:DUF4873 domain-containing protein [Antrihabitans sp. YC2-6]MBJ8344800.1 DUF4873 domain-containing protein [Antrihabitans sp. YC2-6]
MNSVVPHSPHEGSDYLGEATLVVHGTEIAARVEMRGYREPIDGIFRWIGRIDPNPELTAILGDEPRTKVTVRTPHSARDAFVGDPDPWNRYRIMGKSTPPFHVATELSEVE